MPGRSSRQQVNQTEEQAMNTRTLIAVLLSTAFAAPLAMAQEATPDNFSSFVSTASRDMVRADAAAALKAGLIERGEASRSFTEFVSTKSRVQVVAEAREALRLGVVGFGEGPAAVATPAQAEAIRLAGLQATMPSLAQATR
jgi:hypothetical protein